MNMNCKEAKQHMFFLAEGEIDPGLSDAMHKHLAGCSGCNHVYEEIRQTLHTLSDRKETKADPWFAARMEQTFRELQSEPEYVVFSPAIRYLRFVPVAASFLLALYLGIHIGSEISGRHTDTNGVGAIVSEQFDDLISDQIYQRSFETFFLTNGE